ncbi:MAG: adenylate/guanylate cyclase domain-containing protein [Bacteroidota bacterium]
MSSRRFSILFVDDEEHNLFAFKAAFRREYDINTARNGKEAIDFLRSQEVQLVITDQRMPEMTGVELLDRIRKEFPEPIRMILTGYSDVEAVINAINAGGVYRYITKPWDKDEVRMNIENARELYELTARNQRLLKDLQKSVAELRKTVSIFSKYVPKPVVDSALQRREGPLIQGELLDAAILFCDIRGFTPLSEVLEPQTVVHLLNEYYSTMSKVVDKHNGSVNQFIGDEVYATFGAPLVYPNNCQNAVLCALEMLEKREKLNQSFQQKFGVSIDVGIGINAGKVIAGNMGSDDRLNYGVIGDTVNTGKRIEGLTKDQPNSIFISDAVYQEVSSFVHAKNLGAIEVRGKKEKVIVHQLLGKY